MSSRRESGVRGRGSGVRSSGNRLTATPTAAFSPRCTTRRVLNSAVWFLALAASLMLGDLCRAGDSTAERRQRIKDMKPAEKKQLLRKQERFAGLKPEEQKRLRELHREVEKDPKADQLRRVMHAYCEWLKSFSAYEREELLDLEPAKRIERIRELRAEEDNRVNPKYLDGLSRWVRQYAADPTHQAEILRAESEEDRQRFFTRRANERTWIAARILWEHLRPRYPEWRGWPGWSDRPDWLTDEVLADLRKYLPDATGKRLKKMSADQQWEVISGWVERSAGRGFSSRHFRDAPPPEDLQEEISQFFEKLSSEEKDRLLSLPADELQRELREMYFRQLWPMPGWMGWGGRGPPGPPRDRSGRTEEGPREDDRSRDP